MHLEGKHGERLTARADDTRGDKSMSKENQWNNRRTIARKPPSFNLLGENVQRSIRTQGYEPLIIG